VEGEREAGLVLIVDDDPDFCDLVAFALELYLIVKTARAEDGEQALDLVRTLMPDMVLLDIRLPKMDGLEVARRLKADPQTWGIPLVAITSTPLPPTIIAGCDYYFSKPFELFGLVERLKDYFEARPDPGAAA
jgi:CheY-like chemotaxis protein